MRYAYIKQNNAVKELKRVALNPAVLPQGGPDAYVAHFLNIVGSDPALLLSVRSENPNGETAKYKNVQAKTYYWFSKLFRGNKNFENKPIFVTWPRLTATAKIAFNLIKFRPDVILCWAKQLPLWGVFISVVICKSKFIYSRHNSFIINNQSKLKRIFSSIDIWIIKRASKVIVHGPYLREQAIEVGVDSERLVEFNWNFNDLPPIPESKKPADKLTNVKKSILFIGRIESSKGIYELLDACEQRLKTDSNLELIYAGNGNRLDLLSLKIKERKLSEKVTLLGMVPHEDLANLICKCDVVVTPTRSNFPEGRCMATMESLVMGVPVIAPDFGPFPYLVKHGENGLLYKPDSVTDLQKNLFMLLDDNKLYENLCAGARSSSKILRTQGPNYSDALRIALK